MGPARRRHGRFVAVRPTVAVPVLLPSVGAILEMIGESVPVEIEGDALAHDFSAFDAPLDDNMAYEFHAYALTGLEDWANPGPEDIEEVLALRAAHGRPLWLGEFGEGTIEWQTERRQGSVLD